MMKMQLVKMALAILSVVVSAPVASGGNTLYWDGDGLDAVGGGAGPWNTTDARWSTDLSGLAYQPWVNTVGDPDSAVFGEPNVPLEEYPVDLMAVTVDAVTVNKIDVLNVPRTGKVGYTFSGGTIAFDGPNPTITTNGSNVTAFTTLASGLQSTEKIIKAGAGRLQLSSTANTVPGYIINGGYISFSSLDAFGPAPEEVVSDWLTIAGGTITAGFASAGATGDLGATRGIVLASGNAYFGGTSQDNAITISGPISGAGKLFLIGGGPSGPFANPQGFNSGGTWILSNPANNWTNGISIQNGILKLGASEVIPSTTSTLNFNGGVLDMNGFDETLNRLVTGNNPGTIRNTGTTFSTLSIRAPSTPTNGDAFMGVIQDAINLVKDGTNDTSTQFLTGTASNTYTGTTVVNRGVLVLAKSGTAIAVPDGPLTIGNGINVASVELRDRGSQIGDLNDVTINDFATFNMGNSDEEIGSVSGAGNIINGGNLTLNRTSGTATFTGNYSGFGALTKNGGGTQVLTGTNSFSAVNLNSGRVDLNSAGAGGGDFGAGITIASAATLGNSGDSVTIQNSVWLSLGKPRIAIDNASTVFEVAGPVVGDGGIVKTGAGKLVLSGSNSYTGDTFVQAGTLSINNQYLADAADIFLTTGGILELNFSGTPDTIDSLFFNNVPQSTGTWGAPGSGADHISSLFAGTGRLFVSTVGTPPGIDGDFNNDGKVDAGDYVTWRKNEGTNNTLPNDGGLSTPIGAEHYSLWRANFGSPAGAGSGSSLSDASNVPEPTSFVMIGLVGAVVGLARPRKRTRS